MSADPEGFPGLSLTTDRLRPPDLDLRPARVPNTSVTTTFPPATTSATLASGTATPIQIANTISSPSSSTVMDALLQKILGLEQLINKNEEKAAERERLAAQRHKQNLADEKKRHNEILMQQKKQHDQQLLQAAKKYTEVVEQMSRLTAELHDNRTERDVNRTERDAARVTLTEVNSLYERLKDELEVLRLWAVSGVIFLHFLVMSVYELIGHLYNRIAPSSSSFKHGQC
jgi:Fe2+ transport system protein B